MQTSLEIYLALANVPMWHYGFNPLPNSIIHYPPFLEPLPLVNYYDQACYWSYKLMLAFGPTNSPPLESNTEKEDISSTREGQTL